MTTPVPETMPHPHYVWQNLNGVWTCYSLFHAYTLEEKDGKCNILVDGKYACTKASVESAKQRVLDGFRMVTIQGPGSVKVE